MRGLRKAIAECAAQVYSVLTIGNRHSLGINMSKPHTAFLGLGTMGSGMARRLIAAGFPLTVFNRNPARSKGFERIAHSPREAASHADIVISMVADDAASRSIWLGENGA